MAVRTRQEHRYQLCRDEDCDRFPCLVYKEGFRDGWNAGFERGYTAGWVAGYRAGYERGYPEGMAACPRPHK